MVFDYFRRPVCFGCNSPATSRNVDWRCEDCGYENSLDSLGYPHDVCHPNARQERYCYTTTYSFNDILCQTCIDNQTLILHIVQEAGEGFAGRESLERRYPPLCPECEKLVTKHLSELSSKYRPALELFNQRAMELAQVTAHAAWNHLNVLKCFVMLDGLVCGAHLCLRLYTTQALDIRLQLLRMPELSTLHFWFIYTTRMLEIKTINIYRTLLGVLNLLMLSGLARYSYQTPQYKVHKNPPSLFIYQVLCRINIG